MFEHEWSCYTLNKKYHSFHLLNHIYKIKLTNNSMCDACLEEEETPIHFLCGCPALQGQIPI